MGCCIFDLLTHSGNNKTFREIKNVPATHRNFHLVETVRSTLGIPNLDAMIECPPDTEENDFLATNCVEFYNHLVIFMTILQKSCTCPHMTAGARFMYLWEDGINVTKPVDLPALEYISKLLEWADSLMSDDRVFPNDISIPYPNNFKKVVGKIFRRFFRVYGHIYHHHQEDMIRYGAMAHFNSSFRHFYFFSKRYQLIPEAEYSSLQAIIAKLEN